MAETLFTAEQATEALAIYKRANEELGDLSFGQGVDLLLDNLPYLKNRAEAVCLLAKALWETGQTWVSP